LKLNFNVTTRRYIPEDSKLHLSDAFPVDENGLTQEHALSP
jgi:hypothetical protein